MKPQCQALELRDSRDKLILSGPVLQAAETGLNGFLRALPGMITAEPGGSPEQCHV